MPPAGDFFPASQLRPVCGVIQQRMKMVRSILVVVAVLVVLVALVAGVAFTSAFQTWAVRQAVAGQPGLQLSVQRVAAGLNRVQLEQVRVDYAGTLLTLPAAEAELSLVDAAWAERVAVSRLVARG